MYLLETDVRDIPIAGIQGMTTIDYPGHVSAVFFTAGCPWHCRYCHNGRLKNCSPEDIIPHEDIMSFLTSRSGYLDSIVISGGEPSLHKTLPGLLAMIRTFGYKTALHTNGMNPDMIRKIITHGLVDYIALDIKGPPRAYGRITQNTDACKAVSHSIKHILSSGIDYEFRTTYHPLVLSEADLERTIVILAGLGCRKYFIQRFSKDGVVDEELTGWDVTEIPRDIVRLGEKLIPEFGIR